MSAQTLDLTKPSQVFFFAFAIRDIKTNTFNLPFFQTHKAGAMRAFADLARDTQCPIGRHPEDYQLFEIGHYDQENGKLLPLELPNFLANASDFLNQ